MSMGSSFLCVCLQASDCCAATIAVEKIKKENFIKQRSNQRIEGSASSFESRDGSNSLENGSKKKQKTKEKLFK